MSELDKLRDGNDSAARLLRAGSREQPRLAARNRTERALGLSSVTAGALLTSTASATVGAASVGSAARFAIPVFVKWLALGMLAGGTALGGVAAVRNALEVSSAPVQRSRLPTFPTAPEIERARQLPVTRAPVDSAPASTTAVDAPPVNGVMSASSDPARTLPGSSSRLTSPPPAAGSELPPATGDALLSHEVELLERVRAKLRAGNSGEALAELNAVGGDIQSLMMEADLLRVEALLAHGERARAEALAAELQRRGGGQSFRLKRLLGGP